jgi:hypothetical protein
MRSVLLVVAALVAVPIAAQAQGIPEVRPFVGAYIPTGDQADILDVAVLSGAQVAVEAADMLHVVGSFAFTGPDFDKLVVRSGHMHVFQIDVGGELFRSMDFNNDWMFRPYIGAGVGVRRYDPTAGGISKNYPAGYGALGAEFQLNKFAVRFEARDYLSQFKGFSGNDPATTRNEVALMAGMAFHLR